MSVPKMHSLALHEFAGVYRGVHSIEGKTEAGVGEIAVTIRSSGVDIARATLEGPQTDIYPAAEIKEVNPNDAEKQLTEDFRGFKAFRLGTQIMAVSHRSDDKPSLVILGGPGFTSLFGPNQAEIFDQKVRTTTQHLGAVLRLAKKDC